MKHADLSSVRRVGPKAAKLLARPDTIHLLNALGQDELTANEIAQRLDLPLKRIWFRLSAMVDSGILEIAGERKRAGRPQPLYRCAAKEYFVPAELRHTTLGAEMTIRLRKSLDRSHVPAGELIVWEKERFRAHKVADPLAGGRRSIELWTRAALRPEDIGPLEREMRALLDRYSRRIPHERDYLVHFAVAPGDVD